MPAVALYLATLFIFLVLDALMLRLIMQPLFQRHIGPLLADPVRLGPAVLFYAAYVAGLVWLVSLPALKSGGAALLPAAVVGAMAYGTYEFTSYAILRDWHWTMVAVDLVWGTTLTAFAAVVGLWIVRSSGLGA